MKAKFFFLTVLACFSTDLSMMRAVFASPLPQGDLYDRIYPSYVEICAVPQIKRKGQKPGGTGGHAVFFLKDVCLDASRGYPRLKMCEPLAGPEDPDRGVGISVNKMFKNVNWVGIEGKSLLLRGNLSDSEPVDESTKSKLISYVMERGFYRAIAFHPEYLKTKPADISAEQYVVEKAFGTDFALNLGRDIYCSRIPMDPAAIGKIVDTLNGLNEKYYKSRVGFYRSAIRNNCTHPIYAALSAVGFCKNKSTDRTLYSHLTDLAIPSRLFISSMLIGNDRRMDDVRDLYDDRQFSRALADFGYLPFRPGVIMEKIPAHTFQNALFDKGENFLFVVGLKSRWHKYFTEILTQPRYQDVRENQRWFRNRYMEARQKFKSQKLPNTQIGAFRERLLACMETILGNVEHNLQVFETGASK